ncbi:3'-5' exonuclease [Sphingomonas sp. Leaf10]|uniref:3'-5' exonuclease n=1 Tax=Sphingomonas sp. Leaf10 TaxID=1735676 RepID=UPI0006FD443B|nr:3'-5' exonuclease [Sphingomonas sp. Leaf10]KQM37639.1 hypothetical protein ASE59_14245 [Sphingomonas sp. Leaf10]
MSHFIMLDLETLGTVPGCSIVSIGAAHASYEGYILNRFYTVVSRDSCREYHLHEEGSTLDWWAAQSEAARAILSTEQQAAAPSLVEALDAFNAFVRYCGPNVEVYGNGSDFDNAILNAAAMSAGVKPAWPPFGHRCYRTMKSLTPHVKIDRTGTHHNALDDAVSQAEHLGRVRRALTVTTDRIEAIDQFINWMADHYRERTSHKRFGIRWHSMSRAAALSYAHATYDAAVLDGSLAPYAEELDRDNAAVLVDEDLHCWAD